MKNIPNLKKSHNNLKSPGIYLSIIYQKEKKKINKKSKITYLNRVVYEKMTTI
jgi:hypothetical protein